MQLYSLEVFVMANSLVQVRVDEQLKEDATNIYEELGMDLPTAIRIFLKRSVQERGIPFSMKLTNIQHYDKAVSAMQRMSQTAEENGIADMSLEEINQEIQAVRQVK